MTPEEIENKQLVHSNKEDEFAIFRKEISPENPMTEIESIHTINLEFNKVENSPAKPLILIVDDDANVREALKITLGKKYDLILCANGNEAIEKVNLPFFAVILDIKMEGKHS